MSYILKVNYADKSNYGATRTADKIKYIVWHYTANDGDSDENNGKYFAGKNRSASAHYFVDDDSITISVPDLVVAWSVGGKKYSNTSTTGGGTMHGVCTNNNSISIELCDNVKDGKIEASEKTIENAIALTRDLMKKYNIPIERVIRHFDVTGKPCPIYLLDKNKWQTMKHRIANAEDPVNSPIVDTDKPTKYTVQKGDTLSRIGKKLSMSWQNIAKLNNIKAPYILKIGQVLKLVDDTKLTFLVQIKVSSLNIRSGPGTTNKVTGVVEKNEVFTITDVYNNWGKLKSGKGWINISDKYVKRI